MTDCPPTILVCGGRDYADYDRLESVLDDLSPVCVIHGGASGADTLSHCWAAKRGRAAVAFPADWRTHGRAAGPIRNQQMLDDGKPDVVVAFPGGRGTANMVNLARAAGVEVIEVGHD